MTPVSRFCILVILMKDLNDLAEMSLRKLNFDAEALIAVAAKASGASEGNEIAVIAEGIFLFTAVRVSVLNSV